MGDHLNLWQSYMLQFLNLFHSVDVNRDSELFKYFAAKSDLYSDIFHKLVWLHCSFDFIPHNIMRFLNFFDTTSSDHGSPIQENMLELLENPVKCANKVIERFFKSLKIIAVTSKSDEECMTRINEYCPKYHEMVNHNE